MADAHMLLDNVWRHCQWSCDSHNTMSDVEINDILRVCSLDADGERFDGVKGEGHQSARSRWWIAT